MSICVLLEAVSQADFRTRGSSGDGLSPGNLPGPSTLVRECAKADSCGFADTAIRVTSIQSHKELHPMETPIQTKLEERVYRAAESALARQHYVSVIDVLCGMGLLASSAVDSWRKGRIDFLESEIQGTPNKISSSIAIFLVGRRKRASSQVKPAMCDLPGPEPCLCSFSAAAPPHIERIFRTHYVSPALSEHKQQKLQKKLEKAPQPVVFLNLRDAECSECGAEIAQGAMLLMEADQPLCLHCARLDGLEFLPAGDTALTRRATKYSERAAVVVRFNRD